MKDQADRDQNSTRKALAELKTLKTRYPDSKYAQQGRQPHPPGEDTLAAQEMKVGRYYMEHNNQWRRSIASRRSSSDYQTTAHVEEALYRLTAAYMSLGIASEAQNAAAVLGHNFPNSSWYKDSYALLQNAGSAAGADQRLLVLLASSARRSKTVQPPATQPPPAAPPAAARPAQQQARPVPAWPAPPTPLGGPPPPSTLGGPRTASAAS